MNLEQKIASYEASTETVELVRDTKIVLLVGISGAGKDTVKQHLLEKPVFRDIVSHTTRAPRVNNGVPEIEDVDYHFINQTTAEKMIDNQEFIEVKFVHDTVYGTSVAELKKTHDAGKIAVTDIDVQGVSEYKQMSSQVVAIFILPPSYDVWRERLSHRYATNEEFEAEFPRRRESAIMELEKALTTSYYHFIINGDLDRTVRVAEEIATEPEMVRSKDEEIRLLAAELLQEIKSH
jgi:guanylate kinase